jgi:DNA-binding transcriptional regulator LsrR (DeoR family)
MVSEDELDENTRILIKVSQLYYRENLTQQMIAENLRLSRPKVSRLLQQAKDQHIVQIIIVEPPENFTELENKLEKKYGLKEVNIVCVKNTGSRDLTLHELGVAAAQYLNRIVQDDDLIGFTWGGSLAALADSIIPENKNNIRVIQMVGGLGEPNTDINAIDIAKRIAVAMNAKLTLLPAPGIVATKEVREILLAEKSVQQAMELAPKAEIVFVGIGVPGPDSLIIQGNIMSWNEMQHLINLGAVGDIGLNYFDINGNPIISEEGNRVIGAGLPTFKKIPHMIGLAGGNGKVNAILGAIRGGYINTLITDQNTARALLEI